jgi:hypothetical protein
MEDKKRSAHKQKNLDGNEARNTENVALVAYLGLPAQTTDTIVMRRDGKGNTYTVTITKRKRESKLLRLAARSDLRNLLALADDIDGPRLAWSDPEISRLNLMENRQWARDAVAAAVARSRTYTVEVPLTTSSIPAAPVPSPPRRPHVWPAWVGFGLLAVVVALLALAVQVSL